MPAPDPNSLAAASFHSLGVDHVGIAVPDLDAAVAAYRDLLGFTVGPAEVLASRGLRVAFVKTGGTRLELIAPSRPDSEVSAFLKKRGPGVHHICVAVDDLDIAVRHMQSRGATLVGGTENNPISTGAHDTKVAFVHPKNCSGVLIEFVQHPSPAVQEKPHE